MFASDILIFGILLYIQKWIQINAHQIRVKTMGHVRQHPAVIRLNVNARRDISDFGVNTKVSVMITTRF